MKRTNQTNSKNPFLILLERFTNIQGFAGPEDQQRKEFVTLIATLKKSYTPQDLQNFIQEPKEAFEKKIYATMQNFEFSLSTPVFLLNSKYFDARDQLKKLKQYQVAQYFYELLEAINTLQIKQARNHCEDRFLKSYEEASLGGNVEVSTGIFRSTQSFISSAKNFYSYNVNSPSYPRSTNSNNDELIKININIDKQSIMQSLVAAVKNNNFAAFNELLLFVDTHKININFLIGEEENTLLHLAAINHNLEMIRALTAKGADVKISNKLKETPIHTVIKNAKASLASDKLNKLAEICDFLFTGGPEIKTPNNDGDTLLQILVRSPIFHLLSNGTHNYLFTYGNFAVFNKKENSILHEAAGNPVMTKKLFNDLKNKIPAFLQAPTTSNEDSNIFNSLKNAKGETALHYAASSGNEEIITLLLENNADQAILTSKQHYSLGKETALHLAFKRKPINSKIIDKLLEQNPDLSQKNADSKSIADLAFEADLSEISENSFDYLIENTDFLVHAPGKPTILYSATNNNKISKERYEKIIKQVRIKKQSLNTVNNQQYYFDTPLVAAVGKHNKDKITILVKEGADINAPSLKNGTTPLIAAIKEGDFEIAQLLIELGADVNKPDSYKGKGLLSSRVIDPRTPFYYAVKSVTKTKEEKEKKQAFIVYLIKKGVNVKDANNQKAVKIALLNKDIKLLKHLINELECDPNINIYPDYFESTDNKSNKKDKEKSEGWFSLPSLSSGLSESDYAHQIKIEQDGEDLTKKLEQGDTPLHYALKVKDMNLASILIQANKEILNTANKLDVTPFILAAKLGNIDFINQHLSQYEPSKEEGQMAFNTAMKNGHVSLAYTLITNPAYKIIPNDQNLNTGKKILGCIEPGDTALDIAVKANHIHLVSVILSKLNVQELSLNPVVERALHSAIKVHTPAIARLLYSYLDVTLVDKEKLLQITYSFGLALTDLSFFCTTLSYKTSENKQFNTVIFQKNHGELKSYYEAIHELQKQQDTSSKDIIVGSQNSMGNNDLIDITILPNIHNFLLEAIKAKNIMAIHEIIYHCLKNINFNEKVDTEGNTLLHYIINMANEKYGNGEDDEKLNDNLITQTASILERIFLPDNKAKLDINLINSKEESAFSLILKSTVIDSLTSDQIQFIANHGNMSFKDSQDNTVMHLMLSNPNLTVDFFNQIKDKISSVKTQMTLKNKNGYTPVYLAAGLGNKNIIFQLVAMNTFAFPVDASILQAFTKNNLLDIEGYNGILAFFNLSLNNICSNGETPLTFAINLRKNYLSKKEMSPEDKIQLDLLKDKIIALIEKGANINFSANAASPLTQAMENQDYEIAELLIKKLTEKNQPINFEDKQGHTPFYWAVKLNKKDYMDKLNKDLTLLQKQSALKIAILNNNATLVENLIEQFNIDPYVFIYPDSKEKPPSKASSSSLFKKASQAEGVANDKKKTDGEDTTGKLEAGDTPLHYAIRLRNEALIVLCLSKNNEIKYAANKFGITPFVLAVRLGHDDFLDKYFKDYSLQSEAEGIQALTEALLNGHFEIAIKLIKEKHTPTHFIISSDTIATDETKCIVPGDTPLMVAARSGNMTLFEACLPTDPLQKAKILNKKNQKGETVLHIVIQMRNKEQLIKLIIASCAKEIILQDNQSDKSFAKLAIDVGLTAARLTELCQQPYQFEFNVQENITFEEYKNSQDIYQKLEQFKYKKFLLAIYKGDIKSAAEIASGNLDYLTRGLKPQTSKNIYDYTDCIRCNDTPFMIAVKAGDIELAKQFLPEVGEKRTALLNQENGNYENALHIAIKLQDEPMIKWLISEGVKIDVNNTYASTRSTIINSLCAESGLTHERLKSLYQDPEQFSFTTTENSLAQEYRNKKENCSYYEAINSLRNRINLYDFIQQPLLTSSGPYSGYGPI